MKDRIFIFDMDGVLVDTVKQLYSVYHDFICSFSKEVDSADLTKLNGLKLAQIITFAKTKYEIPGTEEELIKQYSTLVSNIYLEAPLIDNVETVLKKIKDDGFKIALASSAKIDQINPVLKRFNLKEYFEFITSGDDVIRGKPFPDIYNLIRDHFGDNKYYVIEDSANGIIAADDAGMNVIFFNRENEKYNPTARYMITSMDQFNTILGQIKKDER